MLRCVTPEMWEKLKAFAIAFWTRHYYTAYGPKAAAKAGLEVLEKYLALVRACGAQRPVDSPSSLAAFHKCPRQYLLTYSDHMPRNRTFTSIEAAMGSAVHEAIEQYHRNGETDDWLTCSDRFERYLATQFQTMEVSHPNPKRTREWAHKQGIKCLDAWWSYRLELGTEGFTSMTPEVEVEFAEGPKVRGVVDLVCEKDDKLVIIDWKTGSRPWNGYPGSDVQQQMRIYGAALRSTGVTKPIELRAVFLAHGPKVYDECLTPRAVDLTISRCVKTRNEIANEDAWDAEVSTLCRWCVHHRGGAKAPCPEGSEHVGN